MLVHLVRECDDGRTTKGGHVPGALFMVSCGDMATGSLFAST